MAVNIVIPKLGMTMKQAKIVQWLFKEGEEVEEGDGIVEIETEKINYQIEAPISGILAKILLEAGEVATVGQVIGIMVEVGETFDQLDIPESPYEVTASEEEIKAAPQTDVRTNSESTGHKRVKATPIAKKIAKEKGIDLTKIKGSGPGGRIRKEDVLAAVEEAKETKASEEERYQEGGITLGSIIPLTQMRKIIGERLTTSSREVPHVYFACEVDGTRMIEFRNAFLDIIESATGVKLSFNDIILKSVAMVIEKYPLFNATLEGKTIKIHREVNIGLAVALEDGLIVPVIRRVNEMRLGEVAVARKDILDKARSKKLTLDNLSGGTFTVSNLGQFNIEFFTSIINPPETGILSVGRMKERPIVVSGEIKIRPTFYIGLSADHRVVDGAAAAAFLQELQRILQNPYLMCLI